MAGLTGVSTTHVGSDIIDYLTAAAEYFGASVYVTSGYRSPDQQAAAMYNNWIKLKRGAVYSAKTLPPDAREKLDELYRAGSKAEFLKLVVASVGSKSSHSSGRALDVRRSGVDARLYKAITLALSEVNEGNRKDIYHFESRTLVPAVDDATRAKWAAIKAGKVVADVLSLPSGRTAAC